MITIIEDKDNISESLGIDPKRADLIMTTIISAGNALPHGLFKGTSLLKKAIVVCESEQERVYASMLTGIYIGRNFA